MAQYNGTNTSDFESLVIYSNSHNIAI